MTLEETYMTMTELAQELKISRSDILDLWTQGKLQEAEVFKKWVLFRREDLESLRLKILSVQVEVPDTLRI